MFLCCYSEVFRSSHQRTPKNTFFSTEHLQATASEFLQKDIDKFIIVRQTKVQKRFIYGEKKQSMEQRETNSNVTEGLAASDKG